ESGFRETWVYTATAFYLEEHGLESTTETFTVTQNGLRAPQLAVPYPTSSVELGDAVWSWDPMSDVVNVEDAPRTYEASYLKLGPLTTLPESIGAPPQRLIDIHPVEEVQEDDDGWILRLGAEGQMLEVVQPDGGRQRPYTDGSVEIVQPDGSSFRSMTGMNVADDPLAVDPRSEDRIRALAAELSEGLSNQIEIAMEIQRYLRGPEFSYSLTLADPVLGPDGEPLDPLSHFLETKQGYCTQFAT